MINHNQEAVEKKIPLHYHKKNKMNIFNNKFLLIAIAIFAMACNNAPSTNDGSMMMEDGSVPMMDGMVVMDVDAGMDSGSTVVDAGHDSGSAVVDAGHDSGTVDAGTGSDQWLCAMNERYEGGTVAPCANVNGYVVITYPGNDEVSLLGMGYSAQGSTILQRTEPGNYIYWYRTCQVTSPIKPVLHTSVDNFPSDRSARLDDCIQLP